MNSSFEGYEWICTADTSCLLLMMHFAISFMYLEGKLFPQIIYVGQSWPEEHACTVISILFIISKSNLLWEGVCVTQEVNI